jgi:hypothetical protein
MKRDELAQAIAAAKAVAQRESRVLAAVALSLGVAQLGYIRWADARPGGGSTAVIGALFLGYAALVGGLLIRMVRRTGAAMPACPACGATLKEMSQRVALATGRCDRCGGEVISPTSS